METLLRNESQNGNGLKSKQKQDYQALLEELRKKELFFEKKNQKDSIISNFDELLRLNYNKSIPEFAQIIIAYFAEKSSACQGVFYVIEQEKQCLKAVGGYACNVSKLPQNEIFVGEGLAGQAVASQKSIFFDNIPAEGIHLQSTGNIKFNVGALFFIPLKFNSKVFGVIELLYLKDLEDEQRVLLEILAKNTAATLESILNNELTQKLLREAQEKESMLQTQHEEMLQNMEELKSIQDEMEKKQNETLNFVKAINSSQIALVEFDLQGNILHANGSFLSLMQYSLEEVVGKPHRIFIEEEYAKSSEYIDFWNKLREGKSQKGEFIRRTKNKDEIYIFGAYSVMKDAEGNPLKVIKLATNITEAKQVLKELENNNKLLRTQEEELRQSLEEIVAVQDNLEEKNIEMEHFFEAINNSSFALIEFDLDSNIINANQAFLNLFAYELDEIIGAKHRMFVSKEYANSEEYINFWNNLKQGIAQKGVFNRINKNNQEVKIKGAYSIIKDKEGKPLKILKLATEI